MLVVTQSKHGKTLLDGNTSQIHKRAIYCHWRREWRSWDNQFLAFSEQVILVISPVENEERTGFLKFGVTVSFWNGRLDLGMRSHLQFLEYAWYVKVYSTWPAQWAPRNALRVFVCVDLMVALSRTDCQAAFSLPPFVSLAVAVESWFWPNWLRYPCWAVSSFTSLSFGQDVPAEWVTFPPEGQSQTPGNGREEKYREPYLE